MTRRSWMLSLGLCTLIPLTALAQVRIGSQTMATQRPNQPRSLVYAVSSAPSVQGLRTVFARVTSDDVLLESAEFVGSGGTRSVSVGQTVHGGSDSRTVSVPSGLGTLSRITLRARGVNANCHATVVLIGDQ